MYIGGKSYGTRMMKEMRWPCFQPLDHLLFSQHDSLEILTAGAICSKNIGTVLNESEQLFCYFFPFFPIFV